MGKRKNRYDPQPWEGSRNCKTFARISTEMMHHAAWIDLPPGAKILYQVCVDQRFSKKPAIPDDDRTFFMNQAVWADEYQLYKRSNWRGFARDMSALIDHGFIICVYDGAIAKKKSIYRYSGEWLNYGTPAFSVSENDKTVAMKGTRKTRTPCTESATPAKKAPAVSAHSRDLFSED